MEKLQNPFNPPCPLCGYQVGIGDRVIRKIRGRNEDSTPARDSGINKSSFGANIYNALHQLPVRAKSIGVLFEQR